MDDLQAAATAEHINLLLGDWTNTVRAHDLIHPDRFECGGVGGCLLMRTEHDARVAVTDAIEEATREGLTVAVTAEQR